MGFVDMDYDIISYSDQMPLAQHYSYFIIYSPSKSRFHVIPYKDDEYLNRFYWLQISLGFSIDASNISSQYSANPTINLSLILD
uniref:Uncharacterized 9.7 kDa protein in chlB-trnK intergenic region n=2 Tax=Pinus subgen. Pinus TaxID=139271 RepID=YCX1_PINTH|nr:ORF83 [Pinus thunbergii]YP_009154106.1 ORF83 [Pinus taiwanensis]Q00865.1 RecName: Full=Uncharacterized 9.7 kDa protein in chlB-trnK intergenic region; AltName: Full=ORF 83 [Pinus thunbergii]AKE32350.1 ORF83 [Pinus taiwanensis]BAA02021.1 ORF83 [Pinus thunbergii]BAA04309.1 ORF83 [Pinus thunbergii]